jgi:guanylate kinase
MAESRGLLLVISGPSGVGKSTIAHAVEQRLDATFSVSMTTRPPAPTDRQGIDYYFVDDATFERAIEAGDLLEWARVFDNLYGTPRAPVEQAIREGQVLILEIDVAGAIQIRRHCPDALMVFIGPPSEQTLLDRLRSRARDSEQIIQRRFSEAQREIREAHESGVYDAFVVNDELEKAIDEVIQLVTERRRS